MSIESMMPSNQLIFCHPLLFPPSIFPSIRVFFNDSALCIRWPKYWSFYFSISPSNEYSGLISFRIHWFDLLAVQGTLKSILQHHNLKASICQHSSFFMEHLLEAKWTGKLGYKFVFSRYKENLLLKLIVTYCNMVYYTFISWIVTFIFVSQPGWFGQ